MFTALGNGARVKQSQTDHLYEALEHRHLAARVPAEEGWGGHHQHAEEGGRSSSACRIGEVGHHQHAEEERAAIISMQRSQSHNHTARQSHIPHPPHGLLAASYLLLGFLPRVLAQIAYLPEDRRPPPQQPRCGYR